MPAAPAVVCKVPLVGKVTPVFPVMVPVNVKAPEKAVFPPTVMVPVFATPVPPLPGAINVALEPQTPLEIVPSVVIELWPT